MSFYDVYTGERKTTVEADRFEVEGGALVFYESNEAAGTIAEMTADPKIQAFSPSEWNEVERV